MNVEKRSIDFIPENERYGKPGSLFYIWFGANMNITTIASGVLPVVIGLNLFWSAVAIILGSLIGAIFMASHSAQGPKLAPQLPNMREGLAEILEASVAQVNIEATTSEGLGFCGKREGMEAFAVVSLVKAQ